MTILVHGGTGALGQALISIALYLKCRVFAAVGDTHKKRFLLKLFPELRGELIFYLRSLCNGKFVMNFLFFFPDNYIISSRDENLADVVLNSTDGRGCDIVVTCGKREMKTVSTIAKHPLKFNVFKIIFIFPRRLL